MQTLRKKSSPLKYKNETTRFLGDGVSFKAKLIGILEVSEARGDRMCQEALSDLKMAIRAAGEHKQRITINIAIDGLRLRDEKTGDSLYHHPVHKISFIAQDMTDSRAFGYIFGSPDTGHRFFGIKTDKAASQVVIAMRDLFQVVFALKKKEIELAKQHLDKTRYSNSPIFSDSSISSAKASSQETTKSTASDSKTGTTSDSKSGNTVVANLVDLELELNSLQQGLHQMERITPSDPFGSKDDPFGDSFTSYTKPILPPPPSSGREKSSRLSESSSIFSPKTPQISTDAQASDSDATLGGDSAKGKQDFFSHDFNTSHDQTSKGDWFNSSSDANSFDKPFFVPEPTKEEKHEKAKLEILSQFDVFTDLDPLGTGRSKPYVDKKLFFQELKNPPKKVLNDLVPQPNQLESVKNPTATTKSNEFTSTDPFGEDPFITEDPFAESDFSKQDPFDTEFTDFKNQVSKSDNFEHFKFDTKPDSFQVSKLLKTSLFEKQMSLVSTSPKNIHLSKQNTFDARFDKFDSTEDVRLLQLHSNQSLESDNVPEPPPRPEATLMQIKPPPLPPKKQANDLSVKPPPRPPPSEEPHIEQRESDYEIISTSFEFNKMTQKSPPLPVPARRSRFESDFSVIPERPSKNYSIDSSDENYLTPISFPEQKNEIKTPAYSILLPPPQKSTKKQMTLPSSVTSQQESKGSILTTVADTTSKECSIEGLDITLSQLTLSGLNELAIKLKIPSKQLSNMTLVQLTNYLSNFINAKASQLSDSPETEKNMEDVEPFKADFASNFENMNRNTSESFDRYAVFRELMNEGLKQTKIDTEPEEIQNEKNEILMAPAKTKINNIYCTEEENGEDKYAALRQIVDNEIKINADVQENNKSESEQIVFEQNILNKEDNEDDNVNTKDTKINTDESNKSGSPYNFIEYTSPLEFPDSKATITVKSPKSPTPQITKSPVPVAVTEIIQDSTRLNSGSLSDVVSGSSPEVDNTMNSDEKKDTETAGESWAIFDQTNISMELPKEKRIVQSEEGLSPWSSDSKEFGNGSPPEWRRGDSGSAGECWVKKRDRRDHDGWWDTSAEPETQYYPSNRRSTDSFEEEYYECYEKPRRRKQVAYLHGSQGAGGHSSSSRDVSPWEEEPRRSKEQRSGWMKHARQYSLEKQHRDRRQIDSWDDEDDNEYEEEHIRRFHRAESRERYNVTPREYEPERWDPDWIEERRLRRRREGERDKWCCSDWDQTEHEKPCGRYGSSRWMGDGHPIIRRDRKMEDRYYSRESQESPWEDETNEVVSSNYLSAKRNWKRPSSASEMDRKTGEVKSRYHLGTGGSDGERDKRYKPARRSRSRDSQYSEILHRHKSEGSTIPRSVPYRNKLHLKTKFENDFTDVLSKKQSDSKVDSGSKKSATLTSKERKKLKDTLKMEENIVNTFPRKSTRINSYFENDFASTEESPISSSHMSSKFNFETELTSEPDDSPSSLKKSVRESRPPSRHPQNDEFNKNLYRQKPVKDIHSPHLLNKTKSLFEDDFSPSDKPEVLPEENSISSIKEEIYPDEEEDSFSTNNFESATNSRKKMNKNRRANSVHADGNIKKSESVNIFTRESDPFDDDFFCENVNDAQNLQENSDITLRTTDLKWTDDFEDFDINKKHKNNQRFDN